MLIVNNDFCFKPYSSITAEVSNKSLRKYSEDFEIAKSLNGTFPIVLDTNILLGYYGMSQNEKNKLIQFINSYKDRIYITKQVEQEYLRNRLSVIKKDFFGPLNKILEDFSSLRSEIFGKIQSFREAKKRLLSQDYPSIWEEIRRVDEEIRVALLGEELYNEMAAQVGLTTQNNKNIIYIDELLDLVSTLKIAVGLTFEENLFVKDLFEELLQQYKQAKDTMKWKFAIPGCGEQKEDGAGDFLIFHELLKLMKDKNESCIFLTNDVAKGDWLQNDKNPHVHYLEHCYNLTDNLIYIIHAEKTLIDISFENIHKSTKVDEVQIVKSENILTLESTIVKIDILKGFGFILNSDQNLYFNYTEYEGDFAGLKKNDVVTFEKGTNHEGRPIAKNVKRVSYSFNAPMSEIKREKISFINSHRGIAFITNQPENLYFHQAFMEDPSDFAGLQTGDEVEFIEGRNSDGEKIARLVRPYLNSKTISD